MFVFDEGNENQLSSLKAHADDPAYEVKLQIEMAISRIENGDEALGSVWKQIANRENNALRSVYMNGYESYMRELAQQMRAELTEMDSKA